MTSTPPPRLLDSRELAELLGVKRRALYRAAEPGGPGVIIGSVRVMPVRIGERIWWPRAAVEAALAGLTAPAAQPLQPLAPAPRSQVPKRPPGSRRRARHQSLKRSA